MRATDLLRRRVVDADGADLGPIRDVRLQRRGDGSFELTGLVLGGGRLARMTHSLGVPDGRVGGPGWLLALTRDAVRRARYVEVRQVASWDDPDDQVRLLVRGDHLAPYRGAEAGQ